MQFCCVELHYSKISKSELISMGHELANSFLLFRVHMCFLKMIKNLSWRQRLHFFVSIVLWFAIPECFVLHVKGSVVMFEGRHMFGQFCLVSSVCMLEGWQVVFVPFVEISGYIVQYMILLLSQLLQSLVKLGLVLGSYF